MKHKAIRVDNLMYKGEGEMTPSKVYFKKIAEPKIGSGKIYYQLNKKTNTFDPCIVESGQYLDSQFGRLSNFWYWINLRTGKRECGYGCFLEMVEIEECTPQNDEVRE